MKLRFFSSRHDTSRKSENEHAQNWHQSFPLKRKEESNLIPGIREGRSWARGGGVSGSGAALDRDQLSPQQQGRRRRRHLANAITWPGQLTQQTLPQSFNSTKFPLERFLYDLRVKLPPRVKKKKKSSFDKTLGRPLSTSYLKIILPGFNFISDHLLHWRLRLVVRRHWSYLFI